MVVTTPSFVRDKVEEFMFVVIDITFLNYKEKHFQCKLSGSANQTLFCSIKSMDDQKN
jgi:hypothetical protein